MKCPNKNCSNMEDQKGLFCNSCGFRLMDNEKFAKFFNSLDSKTGAK